MSTIDRERSTTLPPLVAGQRLDRATFHERYEAMPPGTRAELIGGVVVMPSPARNPHVQFVSLLSAWVTWYRRGIPGLYSGCDATTILDDQAEVQPDVQLRILPEYGGQTRNTPDRYIAGAPELVVEVAHASKNTDLGDKLADYERTGVLEYAVVTLEPEEVHWFERRDGRLVPMPPGPDGLFRSRVFPGLWLDPAALFADDLDGLLATLELGRATPEHAAFAAEMARRRPVRLL
jgi:Uma2 family endonuclease